MLDFQRKLSRFLRQRLTRRLQLTHHAGFFSCCTVAVYEILNFINTQGSVPRVDFSGTFNWYKDEGVDNIYSSVFEFNENVKIPIPCRVDFPKLSMFSYKDFDYYPAIDPIIKRWFSPSERVIERKNYFLKKYDVCTDTTLAVYFRGTDKFLDLESINLAANEYMHFVRAAEALAENNPGFNRIFLQSDQQQFIDFFQAETMDLGIDTFVISETPTTTSNRGIHYSTEQNKLQGVIDFFAVILLLSECRFLVLPTGNVARWANIYRKGTQNTVQFMDNEKIIDMI